MKPKYLELNSNILLDNMRNLLDKLSSCNICPRQCQVNRLEDERGFCQAGRLAPLASYHLHFGEEDPLVGQNGSGTIFFAGCNLGCLFCQNYDLSHSLKGSIGVNSEQLATIMLDLQKRGAHNINFVTPTHVIAQIIEALPIAIEQGLNLPLVYNSSGYDSIETLELLDGLIDIYMPDTKFADSEPAQKYCQAKDYPQRAKEAIKEMHRQTGDLYIDEDGLALRGLLIRHLLMPQDLAGTQKWFDFISREISKETYLNVMDQYRPCGQANLYPELQRGVTPEELEQAVELASQYGLKRLDRRKKRSLRDFLYFLNR